MWALNEDQCNRCLPLPSCMCLSDILIHYITNCSSLTLNPLKHPVITWNVDNMISPKEREQTVLSWHAHTMIVFRLETHLSCTCLPGNCRCEPTKLFLAHRREGKLTSVELTNTVQHGCEEKLAHTYISLSENHILSV